LLGRLTSSRSAQESVEPADDVFEALDAPVRSARATQVVALLGETDQLGLDVAQPPQLDEQLLGLLDRAPQVRLAVDE
jgi:hypothetical protein